MVFSSHLFLFYFLPLVLVLYYAMPRRGKHLLLTLLSYIFYGWANPLFVVLMFTSTVIDYICGLIISDQWSSKGRITPLRMGGQRTRKQKIALVVSIITNLSLLGFFKYFNFLIDNVDSIFQALGVAGLARPFYVTLPLGISFYTFQSMSYSIDVYRGDARAIRNFTDFSCYVSLFPQLVAGPIIRFKEVAEQLESRTHTAEKFARGVAFLCMGMAKKILLANPCGKVADMAFDAGGVGILDAWFGVGAYAFQIYFDFSGYSDMAIGLGLMLGFVFPKNFDSPYLAQSITEFWRRWHISLSNWLKLYLYVPLGGNRRGPLRTYLNLAVVMLLGGLWHGASWNFVIWGAIHGGMLAFERAQGKDSVYRNLPRPVRVMITFVIILFSWVFFRAETLPKALNYIACMLGFGTTYEGSLLTSGVMCQPYYVISTVIAAAIVWAGPQTWDWTRRMSRPKVAVVVGLFLLSLLFLTTQAYNPFIYFMF